MRFPRKRQLGFRSVRDENSEVRGGFKISASDYLVGFSYFILGLRVPVIWSESQGFVTWRVLLLISEGMGLGPEAAEVVSRENDGKSEGRNDKNEKKKRRARWRWVRLRLFACFISRSKVDTSVSGASTLCGNLLRNVDCLINAFLEFTAYWHFEFSFSRKYCYSWLLLLELLYDLWEIMQGELLTSSLFP